MRRSLPAVLLALAASPAGAADAAHPLVIELFQSQGCSSCPPANAALIEFGKRPDVLALNFAVDYWDRLGWKDTFARPEYTSRQYDYARGLGAAGVYTPEIVVNGRAAGVGADVSEMQALAARAERGTGGPELRIDGGEAVIGEGAAPTGGADVWLAFYDPRVVQVPVARGENSGRTLPHGFIVHRLVRLGAWSGPQARFALPANDGGWAAAVWAQGARGGPILAATRG